MNVGFDEGIADIVIELVILGRVVSLSEYRRGFGDDLGRVGEVRGIENGGGAVDAAESASAATGATPPARLRPPRRGRCRRQLERGCLQRPPFQSASEKSSGNNRPIWPCDRSFD